METIKPCIVVDNDNVFPPIWHIEGPTIFDQIREKEDKDNIKRVASIPRNKKR